MRWKRKPLNVKIGDQRWVQRFAFMPTLVGDEVVWLETYWEMEEYRLCGDGFYGWASHYPEAKRSLTFESDTGVRHVKFK